MTKVNRVGAIYANGKLAGHLTELREGMIEQYEFVYAESYLTDGVPIGHHFPLRAQPFTFDTFPPFFQNLVSEGWVKTFQASRSRLDKNDEFGLLLANGEELIGALSVLPLVVEEWEAS